MDKTKVLGVMLLIAMISVNILKLPLVYLDFQIRKEYIAQNLCENRDRPITMCYGKCYLTDQLKKAQESESSKEQPTFRKIRLNEFYTTYRLDMVSPIVTHQVIHLSKYSPHYSYLEYGDIFNPPQLA